MPFTVTLNLTLNTPSGDGSAGQVFDLQLDAQLDTIDYQSTESTGGVGHWAVFASQQTFADADALVAAKGSAALAGQFTLTPSADESESLDLSSLTASTQYYLYVGEIDTSGEASNVVETEFTTPVAQGTGLHVVNFSRTSRPASDTFSGVQFSNDRHAVLIYTIDGANGHSPSSVTIGGVAATQRSSNVRSGVQFIELWDTGTTAVAAGTGDVVINYSGSGVTAVGVGVFDVGSKSFVAASDIYDEDADPMIFDRTTQAGEDLIGILYRDDPTANTLTNTTNLNDAGVENPGGNNWIRFVSNDSPPVGAIQVRGGMNGADRGASGLVASYR